MHHLYYSHPYFLSICTCCCILTPLLKDLYLRNWLYILLHIMERSLLFLVITLVGFLVCIYSIEFTIIIDDSFAVLTLVSLLTKERCCLRLLDNNRVIHWFILVFLTMVCSFRTRQSKIWRLECNSWWLRLKTVIYSVRSYPRKRPKQNNVTRQCALSFRKWRQGN